MSKFGFTSSGGIVDTGGANYPAQLSTKRVRISDAIGANGISLISTASQPSDYKLRTVLGVDGVVTTIAGDNIQMSAGALAARVAALDAVILKKTTQLNLFQTELDLVPAVLRTFSDSKDLLLQPKDGGQFLVSSDISAKVVVNNVETFIALGAASVSQGALVTSNKSYQDTKNASLKNDTTFEVTRATGAEVALGVRITEEKDRAVAAEFQLTAAANYNTAQDAILVSSLNTEIASRISNDTSLQTQITSYNTRAVNAEALLTTNLTSESFTRGVDDVALGIRVTNETTRATGVEATHAALITGLTTRIATEETLRASQVAAVEAKLTSEMNDRIAAVTTVTNSLNTKYDDIDTAFGNFVAVATSRDEYLLQRIDFVLKNTDAAAIDSLSELVNRQNAEAVGVYSRLQMLEDIVTSLKGSPIYTLAHPRDEPLAPMVGPS